MRGGGAGSPPLGWAMRSTSYKLQATSSDATATLWVKRCFGIRAEQHLAVRLEVDVQHVVRVRYAWVCRLKLDGLPEHLHRSLPYICSLPLQTYHLAFLTEQEYGRFFRVHLSFWKLSLQEFVVYSVNTHSPWTLRVRNARALRHVPPGQDLFYGKPFEVLAKFSNLLGWVHRLSGALGPSHPRKGEHRRQQRRHRDQQDDALHKRYLLNRGRGDQPRQLANATTLAGIGYKAHHSNAVFITTSFANFGECPKGEVRRIPIPRTTVNKGMKEDRSAWPRPRCSPRRRTRRSDTEELLLLGFEILVGDYALIPKLGEPLQLAHVLGFTRSRGGSSGRSFGRFLAATKVFVRPKPALDEGATPLHARHRPVALPRPPPLCASFRHKSHLRSPSFLLVRLA